MGGAFLFSILRNGHFPDTVSLGSKDRGQIGHLASVRNVGRQKAVIAKGTVVIWGILDIFLFDLTFHKLRLSMKKGHVQVS